MKMARFSAFFYLLLIFLVSFSVKPMVKADCTLAVRGGGCPDEYQCLETCRPCYRGIGRVTAYCKPPSEGTPYDQCMCHIFKGAPCNPPAPPRCPKLPPGASVVSVTYH